MNQKLRILPEISGAYCFVLFGTLLTMGAKRAFSPDTFWHIKAGEIMLDRHSLLNTDIFSHTAYGKPWLAHEWLSEVIMAAIHGVAGLDGVALFFFLIASLTYWLLFKLINHFAGDGLSAFCVTIGVLLSMSHLMSRPHIFTWLFGVATLYILMVRRDRLYLLPLLSVVWANLHGGFVLGILLQVFFIIGSILDNLPPSLADHDARRDLFKSIRKPLLLLILSLIAVLFLNPFGFDLFLFPFQVTKDLFTNSIDEWIAPNLKNEWYFRYYLLGFILALTFNFHKFNWTQRLMLIFFVNSALNHVRHISLAGLFLSPLLAETLMPLTQKFRHRFSNKEGAKELNLSPLSGILATILLASSLFLYSCSRTNHYHKSLPIFFPLAENFPTGVVQFIKDTPPSGKMFNEYYLGGFLIYTLAPSQKVFIDGRADMYGEIIFKDYGKIIQLDDEDEVDKLLSRYEIGWVISSVKRPLIPYLKKTGRWTETYKDDQVVILERIKTAET